MITHNFNHNYRVPSASDSHHHMWPQDLLGWMKSEIHSRPLVLDDDDDVKTFIVVKRLGLIMA